MCICLYIRVLVCLFLQNQVDINKNAGNPYNILLF